MGLVNDAAFFGFIDERNKMMSLFCPKRWPAITVFNVLGLKIVIENL